MCQLVKRILGEHARGKCPVPEHILPILRVCQHQRIGDEIQAHLMLTAYQPLNKAGIPSDWDITDDQELCMVRMHAYVLAANLFLLFYVEHHKPDELVEKMVESPFVLLMRNATGLTLNPKDESFQLRDMKDKEQYNTYSHIPGQTQIGKYQPALLAKLAETITDQFPRLESRDIGGAIALGSGCMSTNGVSQEFRRLNARLTYYRTMQLFSPFFRLLGQNDPVIKKAQPLKRKQRKRIIRQRGYGLTEVTALGAQTVAHTEARLGWQCLNMMFPYDFLIRLNGEAPPYCVKGTCVFLYRDNNYEYKLPNRIASSQNGEILVKRFAWNTRKRNRSIKNRVLYHYRYWEPYRSKQESAMSVTHTPCIDEISLLSKEQIRIIGGRTTYYHHVATNLSLRQPLPSNRQQDVWEVMASDFAAACHYAANPLTLNCLLYLVQTNELIIPLQHQIGPGEYEYCTTLSRLVPLEKFSEIWHPVAEPNERLYLRDKYQIDSAVTASVDDLTRQLFTEELGARIGSSLKKIRYFGLIEGYDTGDHVLIAQAQTLLSKDVIVKEIQNVLDGSTIVALEFVPATEESIIAFLAGPLPHDRRPFLYVSLAMYLLHRFNREV